MVAPVEKTSLPALMHIYIGWPALPHMPEFPVRP